MWQQPKDNVTWNDEFWYTAEPLSKNKVGQLMTLLTKEAKLSKPYTNHCVRSTCITILDENNFEARHIMTLSGHKKEEPIKSYTVVTSSPKKKQMSNALADALVKTNSPPELKREVKNEIQINQPVDNGIAEISELLQMSPEEEKASSVKYSVISLPTQCL